MSINLRRVRAFVTVARTRSITEAAREMHMSPPAVTKSVRELERTLAVELFHRTSSGMLLTPAGKAFQLHAERALSEIEHGREEVALLMGGVGGRVAAGATPEAAVGVLPIALARVIDRRRQIELALVGGTFDSLAREVRTGALDFFLGIAPPDGVSGNLVAEPLYTEELQVVARPGHPLASRRLVTLADLIEFRWIQSASHGPVADLMRRSFDEAGVALPSNTIIIEPLSPLRAVLQHTNLVAAATSVRMRDELDLGQLVALPVPLPDTRLIVSIVRREEAYVSSWAKELIVLLRRVAREIGAAV